MINLVINELKKLFSKKSTHIIVLVLILMMIGITLLKQYAYKEMSKYTDQVYGFENIEHIEERIKEIESAKFIGIENTDDMWKHYKNTIANKEHVDELLANDETKWKAKLIYQEPNIFPSLEKKLDMELEAVKTGNKEILNSLEYKNLIKEYEKEVKEFKEMTEDEYTESIIKEAKLAITATEKEIAELKKMEEADKTVNNGTQILALEKQIKLNKHQIEVAEMRMEKDIPYDSKNYMNVALDRYESQKTYIEELEKPGEDATIAQKKDYQTAIKVWEESKYVLETGQDLSNNLTGNNSLKSFFSEYLEIYLILVIVIAGTIVAEEYSKGTIKNLLVKPYRRSTILTSKLIVTMLSALIFFVVMLIAQILISGILFDFKTMLDPVVEYNVVKESIVKYNLFVYILRDFVFTLPYVLVITFFTFAISTITTSAAAAIILGVMSTGGTSIVNQIFTFIEVTWVKYFPTLTWNWSQYIDSQYHPSYGASFTYAVLMTIATWLVLLIPTYIVFNKRDIKNI